MELISKISKGSKMDQVYIPKRRVGFDPGSYVVIRPLKTYKKTVKPFFRNIDYLESIKISIIKKIFKKIDNIINKYDNIIITGSFLDKGFKFSDIDIILISEHKIDKTYLKRLLKKQTGIKIHIILINNKILIKGLSTDPLYQTMLSRCVAKKRFVYNIKPKINYKILDLHLLKSKLLPENFDYLNGDQKYEMVRNAIAIHLFINNRVVSKDNVDQAINMIFGKNLDKKIKENMIIDKRKFINKYKRFYNKLSSKILNRIKNGSKQK